MNPFLNPLITIPFLKNYIIDPNRIERLSPQQLKNYRDKALRKMVDYAYKVPVYKKKYKDAGIHPHDIRGIKDINKIPFISRQEIRENFPDGVVQTNYNKEKGYITCTGGTTGKYCCSSGSEPVCTYTDSSTMLRSILIGIRVQRFFNLNWRKTKFAHIGNFNPYKVDEVFENKVISNAKLFFSLKNYLNIQASNRTREIIEKLEAFRPDVIISYPAIFQDLAYYKKKGFGEQIKPKLLFVGGAMLDAYTRSYVEDVFGCNMYNTYASCESGAEIAFECTNRNWHIHSDFFHIEAVDEDMQPVAPGERGRLILTRLWGTGTPFVRYTGMEDWITLSDGKQCDCGLHSPIFGKPVEGRVMSNIVLPNGKVFPPSAFLFITSILRDLNEFKVKRYQIIQKKIDEIEILLVIDEDLRNKGASFEEIAKKIKKVYVEETGPEVKIIVKEVKEIKDDPDSGKPAPLVISYVNLDTVCKLRD